MFSVSSKKSLPTVKAQRYCMLLSSLIILLFTCRPIIHLKFISLKDNSLVLPIVQCLKTVSSYNLSSCTAFLSEGKSNGHTSVMTTTRRHLYYV